MKIIKNVLTSEIPQEVANQIFDKVGTIEYFVKYIYYLKH